jgi:hypothetical protein
VRLRDGRRNFLAGAGVRWGVQVNLKLIPAKKSGQGAVLAQPENLLVALFALSPALWLLVFLAFYLSRRVSLAFWSII